jgi:putative ATP-binding cassette transporter
MFSINRRAWSRLVEITKAFFTSPVRWRALAALGLLVALLLSLNGLNVVNSYVGRGFMTAIAETDPNGYYRFALLYLAVFAGSTLVAVFYQFVTDRLALLWRQWLTNQFVDQYLSGQAYYRINQHATIDNPDQRISEDIKTFTTDLLSFFLVLLNSTITTIAFAGVLWSITPWLLVAAVLYALFGTLMALIVGRRLVGLNNLQLKKEADLRYGLVHVREYAAPIALSHGERQEHRLVRSRLKSVVENFKAIIAVNRNLGFFTSGYNYLVPILPVFIVAPRYFRGEIEFGVITQSAMAFAQLLGALSVVLVQFQNISSFAAVVARLGALWEAIRETQVPARRPIEIVENGNKVAYERLTLRTPKEDRLLVKELSLVIPQGRRVLITGSNGAGKSALFRATAGFWDAGEGRIIRPSRGQVMFLPERPFTVAGSLRDELRYGCPSSAITDSQVREVLRKVQFEAVLERVGGLDAERDWPNALSAGEQQLLAFARLLLVNSPFAFLDRACSALSSQQAKRCYELLSATSITFISIGEQNLQEYHDSVLELQEGGRWSERTARRAASA